VGQGLRLSSRNQRLKQQLKAETQNIEVSIALQEECITFPYIMCKCVELLSNLTRKQISSYFKLVLAPPPPFLPTIEKALKKVIPRK
jgi:hypothetical protein